MLGTKSSKWELGFVHSITKFTISRFVISRFECTTLMYFKNPSFFKEISVLLGQTSHRDAGRLLNIIDEDNLNEGM